jgi:Sulfotransferase domain
VSLRVVGAGLPRTGTESLKQALEQLLGGDCYHMTVIPEHPFDLGPDWDRALAGGTVDWAGVFEGYVAAVDWPASQFWRDISGANPDALVLLSVRDSARTWWESMEATVLPVARMSLAPGWGDGRGLTDLLERLTGSPHWDDPALLMKAYDDHVAEVRESVPPDRLLEWRAAEGWEPICRALDLRVPDESFPWRNRREDWG